MIKEYSRKETSRILRGLEKKSIKRLNSRDFNPGRLLLLTYRAVDKTKRYDPRPLIMVMRRTAKHTLGLNFHWLPFKKRLLLIDIILKANKSNIKKRKPLEFDYTRLKPLLKKFGYAPVIRKYINSEFAPFGFKVPNGQLLEFARYKTEAFTGGIPAEALYHRATRR